MLSRSLAGPRSSVHQGPPEFPPWMSIPHRYCRGSQYPGYIRQPPSDIAGMKRGHHATTWSISNAHRRSPCFVQRKIKLAGKRAQNNNNKNKYCNFSDITNRFSPIIHEKTTKLPSRKNRAYSKMEPRRRRGMRAHEWSRDRLLRGG